jgi:hypothetical protein
VKVMLFGATGMVGRGGAATRILGPREINAAAASP